MKCPFCGVENPAHANFCMNCGSPQDLKACEECGGINRKTMAVCQMCGVPFPDNSKAATTVPAPAPPMLEHSREAEALAKETHGFKRFLAELEKDVDRQLAPAHVATPQLRQTHVDPRPVVDIAPPGQMQKASPAHMGLPGNSDRNRHTVIVVIVCFFVALVVYFAMTGRRPEIVTVRPAASDSTSEPAPVPSSANEQTLTATPTQSARPIPEVAEKGK